MFNRGSRPTITESVVESADSVVELAVSTAHSSPDLVRIGEWVRALGLHRSKRARCIQLKARILYGQISNKGFSRPRHLQVKGCKTGLCGQAGVFLSLTLCNKANFDPLQRVKYDGLEKM